MFQNFCRKPYNKILFTGKMLGVRFLMISTIMVLLTQSIHCKKPKNACMHMGTRTNYDCFIERKKVEEDSSFWTGKKTVSLTGYGNNIISRIEIIPTKQSQRPKNWAEYTILAGGCGFSYVTIEFRNKRNHGIHYIVNTYSSPINNIMVRAGLDQPKCELHPRRRRHAQRVKA